MGEHSSAAVEVVILKGHSYAEENPPFAKEDGVWISSVKDQLRMEADQKSIDLTITEPPFCLDNGCVLVDKSTGRITIPVAKSTPDLNPNPAQYRTGASKPLTLQELEVQFMEDLTYAVLSAIDDSLEEGGLPCHLSYDVNAPLGVPSLSYIARALIDACMRYGLPTSVLEDEHGRRLTQLKGELQSNLRFMVERVRKFGCLCDQCGNFTHNRCPQPKCIAWCCPAHIDQHNGSSCLAKGQVVPSIF